MRLCALLSVRVVVMLMFVVIGCSVSNVLFIVCIVSVRRCAMGIVVMELVLGRIIMNSSLLYRLGMLISCVVFVSVCVICLSILLFVWWLCRLLICLKWLRLIMIIVSLVLW